MKLLRSAMAAAILVAQPFAALAQAPHTEAPVQSTDPTDPAATVAPRPSIRLLAGTTVQVEIAEAVSSKTSNQGDTFGLRLVEPIVIDNQVIVSVGAAGGGEVIDARPGGFGGRQGKLVIAGRYLDLNGQRAPIRGMTLMTAGENRSGTALGVSMVPYVGPVASLFVEGGEIEIPVGVRAVARLATDVVVPEASLSATELPQTLAPSATTEPPQTLTQRPTSVDRGEQ